MRPPPAPAAAGQPRSYKPAPLRLDAEGREVDEHGVPVVRKQAVTELKARSRDSNLDWSSRDWWSAGS